jgi:hypothetical protein
MVDDIKLHQNNKSVNIQLIIAKNIFKTKLWRSLVSFAQGIKVMVFQNASRPINLLTCSF